MGNEGGTGRSRLDEEVGRRISEARHEHPSMTLKHAADYLGIAPEAYLDIERGDTRATGEQILLLAELMDVTPGSFFPI